ncbi:ATP-binding protein [Priestia aryabhattai]|uniref:ATP-binding protein n=1 Tax=Priestia aryabhattai TaxID=412384 RepID=UPI002E2332D1|nr:ATP-binding protein [Priestia aryabhattai]
MVQFLDFPVKHNVDNLVFSRTSEVTAVYEVTGFGYDFLDEEEKMIPFLNQLSFLQTQERDLHYLCIPQSNDVTHIIEKQKERMKMKSEEYTYELLESGLQYTDSLKDVLVQHSQQTEKREYRMYIGVQLNRKMNRYKKGNKGTNFLGTIKEFFTGLNSDVNRAVGLQAADILRTEIEAYQLQAQELQQDLQRSYTISTNRQLEQSIRPLSTVEVVRIMEMMYSTTPSYRDISYRHDFISGEELKLQLDKEEIDVIRPSEKSYLDIQSTYIEELDPHTLRLSKQVEGKTETLYSRMFVLSKFLRDENDFPGYEWLYEMNKSLPFPIMTSIRIHYKDNQKILKELSNVKLEFQDQKNQAAQAGMQVDLSVTRNEKGVIRLEDYFQSTGYPSYVSSYVFRINGTSEKQLNDRCESFKKLMQTFHIQVQSVFGEQPSLFMEMIPGSKQINQDYKVETDPRMLSGMMFGGTSALGDNAGFYIGDTVSGKPVFIYPELSSKNFENVKTAFHSISMSIAGATGFGKSVLMNLITYLSVLNGGYAMVIDPKGDRRKWKNGLPFIPKEKIGIWELGKDEEDRGTLDPFRVSPDLATARSVSTNIFSYLVGCKIGDYQYSFLSQCFKHAAEQDEPCVQHGIDYLKDLYTNKKEEMTTERYQSLDHLIAVLETFLDEQIISLLIGQPNTEYRSLDINKPLQVLMIENLSLPKGEKDPEKYTTSEKISTAIMISITSFCQQFMFGSDRTRHKVILQDESSVIDKNDEGRRLMDFIVRQGRYYTTTLLKGSQNASDHGEDISNLGMKFCFSLKKTDEVKQMLDYFDLPVTQSNINTLKGLPLGHCLFQDSYGRTDILRVNPVFRQILESFDTSTSSEKEREFEKNQQNRIFTEKEETVESELVRS